MNVSEMSEDRFWSIISRTTTFEADPQRQLEELRTVLRELPASEIEAFELAFQRMQKRAYRWDLWGATYVIHGGASDDGFEYFQRWLISKGQDVFETVNANPEALADLLAGDPGGPLEFEEFAYVAGDIWSEKTNSTQAERSQNFPYTGAPPLTQPSGTPFQEDEDYLAARYPKLWARFGNSPLF